MNPLNPPAPGHDITRRNFMKKSALTVGAVALLGRGVGLANQYSGQIVSKREYSMKETRIFFRPDAAAVLPYPVDKGNAPNAVHESTDVLDTLIVTSAEVDVVTLISGIAVAVANYEGSGVSGYLYEVTVKITYKKIVP